MINILYIDITHQSRYHKKEGFKLIEGFSCTILHDMVSKHGLLGKSLCFRRRVEEQAYILNLQKNMYVCMYGCRGLIYKLIPCATTRIIDYIQKLMHHGKGSAAPTNREPHRSLTGKTESNEM